MPLQIRRGTEAERQLMTQPLAAGELLYVTDEQKIYVGNGATAGGILVSGYTDDEAQEAAASLFTTGTHSGISFTYNVGDGTINAVVDLSPFDGPIVADSLKGSVFADDSSIIVDAIDKKIFGDVTGNLSGNVIGNVTGDLLGNVKGSIFGEDSSLIIDSETGTVITENILTSTDSVLITRTDINSPTRLRIQSNNERSSLRLTRQSESDISSSELDYGMIAFERNDIIKSTTTSVIIGGSNKLLFGVDPSEIFSEDTFVTIAENCQLGIKTFDPQAELDVRGNARITGYTKTGVFTTVERDALTPEYGMIIYNTTLNKFQGYQNTSGITPEWVDLS